MVFSQLFHQSNNINFSVQSADMTLPIIIVVGVIFLITVGTGFFSRDPFVAFIVFVMCAVFGIVVLFIVLKFSSSTSENDNKKLQSWVQDEYLIDITLEQAEYLFEKQIDINNYIVDESKALPSYAKNAYGEIVEIILVRDKNTWSLLQTGTEIR